MKRKFLLTCAAIAALFVGTTNVSAQTLASVTDGTYYLYDSANKMWMSRGSNYRARAVEDYAGIGFTVATTDSKTTFTLPNYTNNTLFNAGNTVYCDNTTNNKWEIDSYGAGYVIKDINGGDQNGQYLTTNTDKQLAFTADVASATVWQFQTYAQREETLAANKLAATIASLQAAGSTISSTATAAEVATELSTNWTSTDVTSSLTEKATAIAEKWNSAYNNAGTPDYNIVSWSQTDLPNGLYKLSVNASYRMASNDNSYTCRSNNNEYQLVNFYANDEKYPVTSLFSTGFDSNLANNCKQRTEDGKWYPNGTSSCSTAFDAGNYLNELYVNITDGKLEYGFNGMNLFYDNWLCYKNFKLTKYSNTVSDEDATAIKATATDYLAKKQNATVQGELQTAYDNFIATGGQTIANYNTLTAKNTASKASIDIYAAITAKYNTLTESGKTAFGKTTNGAKYNSNTLVDEDCSADLITAVKAEIENGADLTLAVQSAAGSTLDGWTCTNTNTFHVNTWSGEGASDGSNMTTPFIENWIAAGSVLGSGKVYQTIEGLQPNKIVKMTALARVFLESNTKDWAKGISMYANEGSVDLRSGVPATYNSKSDLLYDTYTVYGTTDENGKLELGFDYSGTINFNWFAFKNVTLTLCDAKPTAAIADGFYVISDAAENGKFICRGGDSNTEAMFAETGIPVIVTTDANNGLSTVQFTDTENYLFRSTDKVYTDNNQTDAHKPSFYWTITKGTNGYIFTNKKAAGSLANVNGEANLADGSNELYLSVPAAPTAVEGKMDATVATAQTDAISKYNADKTLENYMAAVAAVAKAKASAEVYASAKTAADAAKAKAEGAGVDVTSAYDVFTTAYNGGTLAGTEAAAVLTAYQNAIVAAMTAIKKDYPYSSEKVLATDISKWPGSTYTANNGNEHWSGVKTNYYEQTGALWGADAWSIGASQTVNLPKGKYAFVVTARASGDVTSSMTVNSTTVSLPNFGAEGKGIATDGTASYSEGTFAKDGAGYGWEYRFVKFELTETTDVTFSLSSSTNAVHNWVSIANPTLYYNADAKDAIELIDAKADLKTAIAAAPKAPTANITETGEAFKYNKSDIDANAKAVADAQAVYDNASATKAEVESQTAKVKALTAVKANTLTEAINRSIKLSSNNGWTYDGKYISFYENTAQTQGGFSIGYFDAGKKGYQTIILTPNNETGYYTMSVVDANNATQYVCTKTAYTSSTGDAEYLRVTTEDAKALAIDIQPSYTEDGIVKLYNTEAKAYIGSKDEGFFTVAQNNNFALVELQAKPTVSEEITINVGGGDATEDQKKAVNEVVNNSNVVNVENKVADHVDASKITEAVKSTYVQATMTAASMVSGTTNITNLTFDVKPVYVNASNEVKTIANTAIKSAITFRLPVPSATTLAYIQVNHKAEGSSVANSLGFFEVKGDANEGGKYIEVSVTSFSEFEEVLSTEMTETRTTTADHYGTICLPYDATSKGVVLMRCAGAVKNDKDEVTGVKFNYVADDGETTSETEVENSTVKAGVPYLYRATGKSAVSFTCAAGGTYAAATAENNFVGTYSQIELTVGQYFLYTKADNNNGDDKIHPAGIMSGETKTYVNAAPYRCYFTALPTEVSTAKGVVFGIFTDDPTGLNAVNFNDVKPAEGKFFQNGQIVIVKNGKKYNAAGQNIK